MAVRSRAFAATVCLIYALCLSSNNPLWAFQSSDSKVESLYAEAQAAEASGNLQAAIAKYQEILRLNPKIGPAYNNLGALYIKQGDYRDASAVLERGLNVDGSMTSARALLGMSLFQLGEYAKARPSLEAVVRENPSDSNAEFMLVNDLTKLGDFEAAATHLQQLSKREPSNQRIWYLLGKVYMQLGQQALGKVNELDPNSVWAHQISAELMESMKNYDGAIVEWKHALAAAPTQPGIHYKLGDLYWSLSQWDNATAEFEQEKKLDPANCMVYWKLGDVLLQKTVEPERALSFLDQALSTCPNLTEARADRGKVLLRLNRSGEALPELLAAARANPAEPSTHFLLAQAYRATGKSKDAALEMKTFVALEQKARNATAEQAGEVIKNR